MSSHNRSINPSQNGVDSLDFDNLEASKFKDNTDKESRREKILQQKQQNEANQILQKFVKAMQQGDTGRGGTVGLSSEKIALLPESIQYDIKEAVLYAYFAVNYVDEIVFNTIVTRANRFRQNQNFHSILGGVSSFINLKNKEGYQRQRLNKYALESAIDKGYKDVSMHFIENAYVPLTWEIIRKMMENNQVDLVKKTIKFQNKFDIASSGFKKITFSGQATDLEEDRSIKLKDIIQIMLELKWDSKKVQEYIDQYHEKNKISLPDQNDLFLIFVVKRKIKLMSYLMNSQNYDFKFEETNFIDVIENDAFDMGVLLYREFFLRIKSRTQKIAEILAKSFQKSNGQLESKCFLIKRFIDKMSYEDAVELVEAIEKRTLDSSKANILVQTLNVVKATCMLIEILELLTNRFGILDRRSNEVKHQLVKICLNYMNKVQSDEEMNYLLMEKDLDNSDSLNMIYQYQIVDLLQNPLAQNIVHNIWTSPYNNSSSIMIASSIHRLLFDYNHTKYDKESQERFYRAKDVRSFGVHDFMFEVWRRSAQSRYIVFGITNFIFILVFHYLIVNLLDYAYMIDQNYAEIQYAYDVKENIDNIQADLSYNDVLLQRSIYYAWNKRFYELEWMSLNLTMLMGLNSMWLFQHVFDGIYSGKTKRIPKFDGAEPILNFFITAIGVMFTYVVVLVYAWNTWLDINLTEDEYSEIYYQNRIYSQISETPFLLAYGILLWCKAFYQLKFNNFSGPLFSIISLLFYELVVFGISYFLIVLAFACTGYGMFYDLEEFSTVKYSMFTLFRTTFQDYDISIYGGVSIGYSLGWIFIFIYLTLNVTLIVNLIVGQLASAYKKYRQMRQILYLTNTLSVREISHVEKDTDKYSSIVSAPFPLNVLNLVLGAYVILKGKYFDNKVVLFVYFMPTLVCIFFLFAVYTFTIMPLCYVKIVVHKFALMVSGSKGSGASSVGDRGGHAVLFIVLGPVILIFNWAVDLFWFLRHMSLDSLDQAITDPEKDHLLTQNKRDHMLNKRTFKKMFDYFESDGLSISSQLRVAQDLREKLDVMEGIKGMLYTAPKNVPEGKVEFYLAHKVKVKSNVKKQTSFFNKGKTSETNQDLIKAEDTETTRYDFNQVIEDFHVVKKVLLNNSFQIDLFEMQSGNKNKTNHLGNRLMFDKKLFYELLVDLYRTRKLLFLKKKNYIFDTRYRGKPIQDFALAREQMSQEQRDQYDWYQKVESNTSKTLKYLNISRLFKVIDYDPLINNKIEKIQLSKDIDEVVNLNKNQSKQYTSNRVNFDLRPSINFINDDKQDNEKSPSVNHDVKNSSQKKNEALEMMSKKEREFMLRQQQVNFMQPTKQGVLGLSQIELEKKRESEKKLQFNSQDPQFQSNFSMSEAQVTESDDMDDGHRMMINQ